MRLARCGVGIALILIAESPTEGIKLVTHLGNPGLVDVIAECQPRMRIPLTYVNVEAEKTGLSVYLCMKQVP